MCFVFPNATFTPSPTQGSGHDWHLRERQGQGPGFAGRGARHEPRRPRKLLLNAREIEKLFGAVERKGMTLVPLSVYFNSTGRAKVELALAKGKQAHDKRQTIKDRDWKRDKARLMRDRG